MFCFAEDNKIISGMKNTITEQDWKKTRIFNAIAMVRGCRPGDNLLSPSTFYMFGLFTELSTLSAIFRKTSELSYYSYIFLFV